MGIATGARQRVHSIIVQLVFYREFAEEAAEFACPGSHPGDVDGRRGSKNFGVYHISDFLWQAEQRRLVLAVCVLRPGLLDWGGWPGGS